MRPSKQGAVTALFAAAAVLSGSCGGGGGGSPVQEPPGPPPPLSATSLRPVERPLDRAELRHLLVRTGFGARPRELRELEERGLQNHVERLLLFHRRPVEDRALAEFQDPDCPARQELVHFWLHLMLRTDEPFRELLAFFWHDHFATSQEVLDGPKKPMFLEHVQMLRRRAVGNLRDLLLDVVHDGAVQVWLDGIVSEKQRPNENLARELWERFSLGVDGGYTQRDVEESARALTGFTLVEDPVTGKQSVVFDPARHDDGPKTIFGRTGRFGPDDIVDLTLELRPAAEFICRRLFEQLCYPAPPPAVVDELARILRENDFELRAVVRTILMSEAFFSEKSRAGMIKSPLEYVVGFSRTTGLDLEVRDLAAALVELDHVPTMPPNVGGWPDEVAWLTADGMLQRGNAIMRVIASRLRQWNVGWSVDDILPPLGQRSSREVVDALVDLLGVAATEADRQDYVEFLDHEPVVAKGVVVERRPSPFDPLDPRHVDGRVRGLLFVLALHPSYHLR